MNTTAETLNFYSRLDTYFPSVSIIVPDEVDGNKIFLTFNTYSNVNLKDINNNIKKINYIRNTTQV